MQDISVAAPVQSLDPVRSSAAEQEQTFFVKMTAILLLHNCGKAVDPKAEICIAAGNIEIPDFCQIYHSD